MNDFAHKLDKPGAGLPWFEKLIAKHVFVLGTAKKTDKDQAITLLEQTGRKTLDLVKTIPEDQRTAQILIPRIRGLEDSSRYWSALMTLEHLLITGVGMQDLIITLSNQNSFDRMVRIEDVKPQGIKNSDDLFLQYEDFLNAYRTAIEPLDDLKNTNFTHDHPWFGPLNAHQWLCLNGFHHTLHLKQIEMILERL